MIRSLLFLAVLAALAACSDGRGSTYSSARAQVDAPVFIPVTPGATPVDATGLPITNVGSAGQTGAVSGVAPVGVATAAAPIGAVPAVAPVGAVPAVASGGTITQVAPAVLTGPIAITPGAVPITQGTPLVTQAAVVTTSLPTSIPDITAQAPAVSLKPQTAPRAGTAQVVRTAAPVAAAAPRRAQATGRKHARGAIYSACRSAGRKGATDRRCGCVQWVADRELTAAQQRRGAGYFSNQQGVQDARQSDNATDERFWTAWKAFGQSAGQQCQSS